MEVDLLNALQVSSGFLGSVDEFNTMMASPGWQLNFRQLSRGAGAVDMKVCATDSSMLLRVQFASRIHQQAGPPKGYVTFGLPVARQASFKLGERLVGSESLTAFDSVAGMDFVTEADFAAHTLSFESEQLAELSRVLEQPDIGSSKAAQGELRYADAARLTHLRGTLAEVFAAMQQAELSQPVSATLLPVIESELPLMLLQVWSGCSIESRVAAPKRYRALRRALDYVHSHPQSVYGMEVLCRESGCSLSTLERAFGEHFGVTPKGYISALRLSDIHRVLLVGEDSRSIGDIAADWGFWHMSKFASDYHRMFGELPSVTRACSPFQLSTELINKAQAKPGAPVEGSIAAGTGKALEIDAKA